MLFSSEMPLCAQKISCSVKTFLVASRKEFGCKQLNLLSDWGVQIVEAGRDRQNSRYYDATRGTTPILVEDSLIQVKAIEA